MRTVAASLAALLLAACGQHGTLPPASNAAGQAATPAAPAATSAKAFTREEKTDLYEFTFSWPAEAAAIPELVARFESEMARSRAEIASGAEEDAAMRRGQGFNFHPFMSSTTYETAGQSPRLLSLSVDVGSYTGGAHGNFGVGSVLWDRAAKRELQTADLFADPANRGRLLTQRWCDALNKAREEKRGEPVGGGGMFDDCPGLDDIAIIPADRDKNGGFETLMLVASPYVAGPWVEGAYEVELAVTPELVGAMKAEFRPSFEAQVPQ